ncbi:MAG: Flagellar protein FhlB-like cytoplasmic domain protein [Clostridia bacterium 62_21]|nr:MAG: Flagellar protein FhlB-like cytoplasmic domain protein [Clostridia bacterium 62_21]
MSEKPKAAAALRYAPDGDAAPRIVAAGRGKIAERIVETAREAGVPVYRDEQLAWTLAGLGVDVPVPPQLYDVVARVIAWVYRLEQRAQEAGR